MDNLQDSDVPQDPPEPPDMLLIDSERPLSPETQEWLDRITHDLRRVLRRQHSA